jgi:group II intron reverse transcriptase/maturase/CRISPR-associated endonuclease Cas1
MNDPLFHSFCSKDTLMLAWQRVRSKQTAGGIDNQTIETYQKEVNQHIESLSQKLLYGSYTQQPYLEVFIPKNETERRRIALLTIDDKIVQTAAAIVLTPIFEKSFLPVSYAYRNKKGAVKAIHKVQHLIKNEKLEWLVSCDIDNFFDTIPHQILFRKLGSFLKSPGLVELIRMFVTMGRVNRSFGWKDTHKGIPQGGVVSPTLANFYLYALDKEMVDHGYGFVRYADDFIILTHTEEQAKEALHKVTQLLTDQLQLKLNEGYEVSHISKGFEFLGISFKGEDMSLSERKFNRLSKKMEDASRLSPEAITPKILEVYKGIHNFYAKLIPDNTLALLDDVFVNLIRNKAAENSGGKVQTQKLIQQFDNIEFLAKQHNFKRKEYLQAMLLPESQAGKLLKAKKKVPINSARAVKKRKHEYQKLEAVGFDIIVATPGSWISKKANKIVVKQQDKVIQEVPLVNLKNITIINEGVSFSSNVIEACADYNISVDFLKHDGKPYAILMQPDWFDASVALAQLHAYENGKAIAIIKNIVAGKITNQINLLKYYGKYYSKEYPAYGMAKDAATILMNDYITELEALAEPDLGIFRNKAFAFEGLAASKYWDTIGILINTKVVFEKRERQGATDLVNCMLNYGYGILYGKITEAIVRANMNPNLSYLHVPETGRPSLVYDFIEEFRQQAVDKPVFALLIKNRKLECVNGMLNDYTKKLLAQKVIERLNTVEHFRERELRLFEVINIQAINLAKFLTGEKKHYKPYIHKW